MIRSLDILHFLFFQKLLSILISITIIILTAYNTLKYVFCAFYGLFHLDITKHSKADMIFLFVLQVWKQRLEREKYNALSFSP